MKTERENLKDAEIGKWFRELPLEKPNTDFTAGVLARIERSTQKDALQYTPLFSTYTWLLISLISIILMGAGIITEKEGTLFSHNFEPVIELNQLKLEDYLPHVASTDILWYASLALILCFGLQVYWFSGSRLKIWKPSL